MISVVIPCYNEEDNLPLLFVRVTQFLESLEGAEVILVNNGSKDESLKKMNQFRLDHPHLNLNVCNVKINEGYGNGILRGLDIAKNDILCWTHADLQTDIMDCKKAWELYQNQKSNTYLLIKGFRTKRRWTEMMLSYGMAFWASLKLRTWLVEVNAQPKLFSKKFYNEVKENAPLDFSLDLHFHLMAKKKGKVVTFPVQFLPRIAGEAKGGSGSSLRTKWRIIKRTLKYINQFSENSEH